VKRVLTGEPIDAVVARGAVANPDAMDAIAAIAELDESRPSSFSRSATLPDTSPPARPVP
jgi:hypothetical protein